MQDVVYINEGMEEVSEVYPADASRLLSVSPRSSSPDKDLLVPMLSKEIFTVIEEDENSTTEDESPSTV